MRHAMAFVCKVFGNSPLVGVEIGVAAAAHAREILDELNIKKLYLVDIWESYLQGGEVIDFLSRYYEEVVNEFGCYENVEILKEYSTVAASKVPDNLDFVYIDGCHDYETTREDISCWYPKVKAGGILSGHDYQPSWPGVIRAVDEFVKAYNYNLHKAFDESIDYTDYKLAVSNSDWWMIKK